MSMEIGAGVTSQIMDLKTSTPGVTRKEEIKTGYQEVNDYVKYLQEKYSYMNAGIVSMKGIPTTVSVSPAFLKKCMDNPEKAAFLEENLAAIPQCTERSIAGCMCTLTRQGWEIDANGNITAWSCGTSDPDGKVAKENAKRRAVEEKADKEKLEKKRAEKKAEQKRLEEKDAKKELYSRNPEDFTVTAIGTDVRSLTNQITEKLASGIIGGTVGFDVKA